MKVGEKISDAELDEIEKETHNGWKAVLRFRDTIEGGIPKDPEVIKAWLLAKVAKGELKMEPQEIEELVRKTAGQVMPPEEDTEEKETSKEEAAKRKIRASWSGFKSDENGLYIEARQVHAMIKECANTMKLTRQHIGLKQILQHGTYVRPVQIYLDRKEPDGIRESITQTPHGSALKRNDYVKNAKIEIRIYYANMGFLSDKEFLRIMALSRENGLGANRSQGIGKFDIIELEKIQEGKLVTEKEDTKTSARKREQASYDFNVSRESQASA